ncbi:hypothetical protein SAMN02910369_01484 [Lachnospiraceae bacterium NE2001]|nr:hypothetical protein SAMN02910369_01484 [Lachnospiraceae bacterium NE2001]
MKKLGKLFGGALLVLVGLGMVEMSFTESDFTIASIIFAVIFALLFVVAGVVLVKMSIDELKADFKESGVLASFKKDFSKSLLIDSEAEPDKDAFEQSLTAFRRDYAQFFSNNAPMENSPVQNEITQIYRNILEFRRNRLRKLGIIVNYFTIRKKYGKAAVTKNQFFDGKYEITEVSENIKAETQYLKDGRPLHRELNREIAYYTVINAKQVGPDTMICPNCGATQTRESLLDGCDYCGTLFMVEDMYQKVSDFSFRSDYEVQYAKYQSVRSMMNIWISVISMIVFTILAAIVGLSSTDFNEVGTGPIMTVLSIIFAILFTAAAFTFFIVLIYNFIIFPFVQIGASANRASQKTLTKLQNVARDDSRVQDMVRNEDPLFSVNMFYSGLLNKLASIHYAETPDQINAFTTYDIRDHIELYENVIDMSTEYISLKNYFVSNGIQYAEVETSLILTEFEDGKVKKRREELKLLLSKFASCKTQAVCGPRLMKCRGCGSSLTLLNGRKCPQCGTDIYLEQYDWVIREYQVI